MRPRSDPRYRLVAALAMAGALEAVSASALETDQFLAWRTRLTDSRAVINAKVNLEITRAIEEMNGRAAGATCEDVARAVRGRLEFEIFQPLEVWAVQSPLVDQLPTRGDGDARYLEDSIYQRSSAYDIAFWMPLSPTVEVNGVRFGTDKLAHFVSSGWRYRNAYLRRIRRGESPERAELGAIRWGILEERSINGTLSSGIFSRADLEANHAGMLFYLNLCEGPDPLLAREGGRWRARRGFDIGAVVTPEWDESYTLPIFRRGRWRKVKPEIEAYCPELADTMVRDRLADYRRRDSTTASERAVEELAREGKLPDPSPFSLEAVCGEAAGDGADRPPGTASTPTPPLPSDDPTPALLELEADRTRRVFGLWRGAYSDPLGVAASLAALFTRLPRTHDCRSLCEMWGLTVHASAGVTGAELAAGWARIFAKSDVKRRFLADVPMAYGVRAALIRTWGDSPLTPAAQTLAGVEAALTITRVSFTAGVFTPISSGARDDWVLTGSIGFGF